MSVLPSPLKSPLPLMTQLGPRVGERAAADQRGAVHFPDHPHAAVVLPDDTGTAVGIEIRCRRAFGDLLQMNTAAAGSRRAEHEAAGRVAAAEGEGGESRAVVEQREDPRARAGGGVGQPGGGGGDHQAVAGLEAADGGGDGGRRAGSGPGSDDQGSGGIGEDDAVAGGDGSVDGDGAVMADLQHARARQIAGQRQAAAGLGQGAVVDDVAGDARHRRWR